MPPGEARRLALRSLALFALAFAVRALHFSAMGDSLLYEVLLGDAAQYDRWARRIAAGDWLGSEVFYQTPLYPYLVGALYRAFGADPWVVRGVQALCGALSCVLVARAGAAFFSERAGWLAGLLLALYPPAIFFDGIVQKASLDLLLMGALLWLVATAGARPSGPRIAGAGLALGAAILNRENATALVPVLLAWAAWLGWPRGAARAAAYAALLALGLAAPLLPVGLRNDYVGGSFLLTTSQLGSNFYVGNRRGADGGYAPLRAGRGDALYERDDVRLLAEDALKRPLSPAEVSRYWLARSFDDVRSAPGEWARLLAWKWFLTWNRVELVDAEALHTHALHSPPLALLTRGLHFGVLLPLAVAGAWWTRREWRRLWPLYAMALAFALSVTLFYVFARYRYPLVPLAALFAGAGLAGFWRALGGPRAGDGRELAAATALAALVAVPANWPVAQRYDDDAITWYNAGAALLDAGRVEDALAALERARSADPRFPETYNNLGRARLALGDVDAARGDFERGLELAPDHAILQLNLAAAARRQGDDATMRAALERAIAFDPLLAPAYGPLAELEFRGGDPARALAHLRRAVELTPGSAPARADLALVLLAEGRAAEALDELRTALRLDPGLEPALLETLAAAQAATGAFAEAAGSAARALEQARARGDAAAAERLERQRVSYLAGRALRESPLSAEAPR